MNRYKPHVLVVPEDDANRQLANGFLQNPALNLRAIQVLPLLVAGLRFLIICLMTTTPCWMNFRNVTWFC